jgi:hypothetical protein
MGRRSQCMHFNSIGGSRGKRHFQLIIVILSGFLINGGVKAQSKESALQTLLKTEMKLTDSDLAAAAEGRPVGKLLKTQDKREVAAVGLIRINLTHDAFLKRFRDIVWFKQGPGVLKVGKLSESPRVSDLEALTLEPIDIDDLKVCRVGDCALKLSEEMITGLAPVARSPSRTSRDQTNAAFRKMLVDYATNYTQHGDKVLITYNDRKRPLKLFDDFSSLMAGVGFLKNYAPEFLNYMEQFPQADPPEGESFIYWSKEKFGFKPVISLTHVLIYTRKRDYGQETLIASKQLFANHYFDSSVGVTLLVDEPSDSKMPGTYLVYVNRSRADALTGFMSGLRRSIVESRSLSALKTSLKTTKQRLETLTAKS